MTSINTDVWRQLEGHTVLGEELVAQRTSADESGRLLLALDSRGRRHLLIVLNPTDDAVVDEGSRGLTARTEHLLVRESQPGRYINVLCEDPSGYEMLNLVAREIAERLSVIGSNPAEIVSRVLKKWRRFWGNLPRQLLSKEAQIGLFSELWFLAYWLIPAAGVLRAVQMWRGPHGARHDFERAGLSIEVKGTASSRGRIHKVNGLDQLDAPEGGRLLLFSLRVRDEAGAANSLPLICDACRRLVRQEPEAEDLLDGSLIAAGFLDAHSEHYVNNKWRVVDELLFRVEAGFPKITKESFANGVPTGVEDVDYLINLGLCEAYVAARKPGEFRDRSLD